jgi:hypothetical protein
VREVQSLSPHFQIFNTSAACSRITYQPMAVPANWVSVQQQLVL